MLVLSAIYFSIQLLGILLVFEKDRNAKILNEEETITNEYSINETDQVLTEKLVEVNSLGVK